MLARTVSCIKRNFKISFAYFNNKTSMTRFGRTSFKSFFNCKERTKDAGKVPIRSKREKKINHPPFEGRCLGIKMKKNSHFILNIFLIFSFNIVFFRRILLLMKHMRDKKLLV